MSSLSGMDKGRAAISEIMNMVSSAPESDLSRRDKMSINPATDVVIDKKASKAVNDDVDYINPDYSDVDQAEIPDNAGTPYYGGTSDFFPYENIIDGVDKKVDWTIKRYIPKASFGVIYGASESFKSFHAISWASSIAMGREWNGSKCAKSPVLYVAAEGGLGAKRRALGWQITYNSNKRIEGLYSLSMPVFIGSHEQVSMLINTAKRIEDETGEKLSAVFIDTLARCFGGADENRTADMNLFVAGCDKIKAVTGASVVVVHHSGKDKEKDARGSSALRGACDFEFCVSRPDKGMYYTLECTKAKDSEPTQAQAFDMATRFLMYDEDGDEVTTLVPATIGKEPPEVEADCNSKPLGKNAQALVQAVWMRTKAGEEVTKAVIRDDLKKLGLSMSNFCKWITEADEACQIRVDGETLIPISD